MARQRFIHPEIWTDPSLAKLSPVERLMFIGMFSNADDEGRLPGNPVFLRNAIFPYDDIAVDEIRNMRDHIASVCQSVTLYEVDGIEYIAFLKWRQYQRPKYPKPSKLPPPPTDNIEARLHQGFSNLGEHVAKTSEGSANTSETVVGILSEAGSMGLGLGMGMGMGSDGEGVGEPPSEELPASAAAGSLHTLSQPPVDDKARVECPHSDLLAGTTPSQDASPTERAILRELRQVRGYPFDWQRDLESIRLIATDFPNLDLVHEARRWRTYKLDKPLRPNSNARLQFRNWCRIAAERQQQQRRAHPRDSPGIDLASIARDAEEQIAYARRLKERSHGPGPD